MKVMTLEERWNSQIEESYQAFLRGDQDTTRVLFESRPQSDPKTRPGGGPRR